MSLERLVFEHDAIDLISRNLRVLTKQEPPDFESAISLLALLAREVESHLEYEDRTVYAVLIDRYQKPPRLLKKACAGLAWRIAGDAGHRRMRRVSGRRGLPGQQLKIVCRGSHGELLGCSGEAPQLERS